MLLALWSASVSAETFVVTKVTDDDGPCTIDDCALREAVLAANALPGADVVEIPGGTYQLTLVGPVLEDLGMTDDIDITDDLEMRGDPFAEVTVVGDGTDRVFHTLGNSIVELSDLVITGGASPGGGGGIRVTGGGFTLRDSAVVGNTAKGDGGGIQIGAVTTATIERCLIEGNSSEQRGGGLFITLSGPFRFANVINTTVANNTAFVGGGIYLFGTAFHSITNSTIVDNESDVLFSDGFVGDITNRLTLKNSLFVNNECGYISAIPMSNGHNMEGPTATCFVPGDGDQMGVPDILLGPLADNGGPTRTFALLPGSPAIDAGLDSDCPATDQRGVARPLDGDFDSVAQCDIGAFEAGSITASEIPTVGGLGLLIFASLLATAGLFRRRLRHRRRLE